MSRPRPPSEETVACAVIGRVAAPPSVTAISTAPSVRSQERSSFEPGSGLACRMALLSNSLTTSTASPTTPSKIPAAVSSAASRWRATATLAGAHGRTTVPAILTSLRRAPELRRARHCLPRRCPALAGRKPPAAGGRQAPNRVTVASGRRPRPDRAATRLPGRGPGRPGQRTGPLAHRLTAQPESAPGARARRARDVRQPRAPEASGRA
jgi:hypothetical protein